MTIEEIEKIKELLLSTDEEMQNLGMSILYPTPPLFREARRSICMDILRYEYFKATRNSSLYDLHDNDRDKQTNHPSG